MSKLKSIYHLVDDNYASYYDLNAGARESHRLRILLQILTSLFVVLFVDDISDDCIAVAITVISILLGFAFSSIFIINAGSVSELPAAVFPEDHDDRRTIVVLSGFFRSNVSYFVPLALFTVFVLLSQMINPSFSKFSKLGFEFFEQTVQGKMWIVTLPFSLLISLNIFLLQ